MKCLEQFRRATVLVAFLALAATTASAEPGTVTVTGVFTMDELSGTLSDDLAAIYEEGAAYTWTLTLYGTTYSHRSYTYGRITDVHASWFDLQFSGPNGDALTQVVSEALAGGEAGLELTNFATYGATMMLWVSPATPPGLAFWAGHESDGLSFPFPVDADGYPTVESDPFDFWLEVSEIVDSGSIRSWYGDATIAGDLGTPIPARLSIADGSVVEGDRGTRKVSLSVTLANASDHAITVDYRTVNGTAVAKSDYTATSSRLTFQAGETVKVITITIKSDRKREADEVFTVELFNNLVGTTIDDGVATVTILNDD